MDCKKLQNEVKDYIMKRIGVIGATGYVGSEILSILSRLSKEIHPPSGGVDVTVLTSERVAGAKLGAELSQFIGTELGDKTLSEYDPMVVAAECDVVFVALGHTQAMKVVSELHGKVDLIVDTSADFRLGDPGLYESVYETTHTAPGLLGEAAYGLPELFRAELAGTKLIASPGCYPTASILGLYPAVNAGLGGSGIIIDAKSGASGAGRVPSDVSHYGSINENLTAYKIGQHRHQPEIELYLREDVVFVPHLIPMDRGILMTAYISGVDFSGGNGAQELYENAYSDELFVHVLPSGSIPSVKSVRGTNNCQIGVTYLEGSSTLVVVSAIDNLVKGAAGQAVQAMNIALGNDEAAGLRTVGVSP